MSLESKYNLKSPGVKRLMREALELAKATEEYYACPLEDNLFEWHFTVRGPPGTDFENGFYHGRILLPSQYPMQPPNIILLTPNGRFEINKKICLSISGYHPESWQPSWSIRTALLALIAFMPTPAAGTIGSLEYTPEERQLLARKSQNWECSSCGKIAQHLNLVIGEPTKLKLTQEESSLIKQIELKAEEDANKKEPKVNIVENVTTPITDDNDGLRQRKENENLVSVSQTEEVISNHVNDSNLVPSNQSDRFWGLLIWMIVITISLLVIRRLFFL